MQDRRVGAQASKQTSGLARKSVSGKHAGIRRTLSMTGVRVIEAQSAKCMKELDAQLTVYVQGRVGLCLWRLVKPLRVCLEAVAVWELPTKCGVCACTVGCMCMNCRT